MVNRDTGDGCWWLQYWFWREERCSGEVCQGIMDLQRLLLTDCWVGRRSACKFLLLVQRRSPVLCCSAVVVVGSSLQQQQQRQYKQGSSQQAQPSSKVTNCCVVTSSSDYPWHSQWPSQLVWQLSAGLSCCQLHHIWSDAHWLLALAVWPWSTGVTSNNSTAATTTTGNTSLPPCRCWLCSG